MTRQAALAIDVSVLRFAVAQLIANSCRNEADPNGALRRFAQQIHGRIEGDPIPEELQDVMALMSRGADNLMHSAQIALGRQ